MSYDNDVSPQISFVIIETGICETSFVAGGAKNQGRTLTLCQNNLYANSTCNTCFTNQKAWEFMSI